MTTEQLGILVFLTAVAAIILLIVGFHIYVKRHPGVVPTKEDVIAMEDALLEEAPSFIEIHGKVIHLQCSAEMVPYQGYRMPKAIRTFLVIFLDDDGEQHEIYVDEEAYNSFEEGQVGTITLSDIGLYSFVLDEENTSQE